MIPSGATHLWLVRHGEVSPAHHGTFYGGADVPLSVDGAARSLDVARALAEVAPDVVVSSPLVRALAVAEPLAARCGLTLRVEPDLRELDRGEWTHLSAEEIERQSPGALARYLADPERDAAPGGETEEQLCARVWAVIDRLATELPGKRVVAVAHGHVIRATLRRLQALSAAHSLGLFVPYHAVVELLVRPDGSGKVLELPAGELPEALARALRLPRTGESPPGA